MTAEKHTPTQINNSLLGPTFAGGLDADGLEASVEGRGVDDVGAELPVVLPVDEERHDDGDNQAHDHGYDNTHIESDVVCAGGHWRRGQEGDKTEREESCASVDLIRLHQ